MNKLKRNGLLALILMLLTLPLARAGESGTTLKADELKAEPFRDAKTVATLAAGSKVSILKKDGGWLMVKSGKSSGWIRMLGIRRGELAKKSTGNEVAGLASLASGRAGTGRVVATTGIRGLNEEELKAAKFNETEVKLAESFLTSRAEAQKFAVKGKLVVQSMNYLPDTINGETP
jgi:hypothetical protein